MAVKSPAKIARVKKWLKALRSGKYNRTTGLLRRTHKNADVVGHCCLGVLCDIVDPNGWYKNGAHKFSFNGWNRKDDGMISKTFLDSVGLTMEDGRTLARLNDSGKYSFDKIADKISELTGVKG